jgi:hypothetical protein
LHIQLSRDIGMSKGKAQVLFSVKYSVFMDLIMLTYIRLHTSEYEDDSLMGICAVYSSRSWRRFERVYCLHHQGNHRSYDKGTMYLRNVYQLV